MMLVLISIVSVTVHPVLCTKSRSVLCRPSFFFTHTVQRIQNESFVLSNFLLRGHWQLYFRNFVPDKHADIVILKFSL